MKINKQNKSGIWFIRAASLVFWLAVWGITSHIIKNDIFLPSPINVIARFFELLFTREFYITISVTVGRILSGFFLALLSGIVLATVSGMFKPLKILFAPLMTALKSVPVASFVILALLWFNSEYLSSFIAFIMVFPIIYLNVLNGIDACDIKMIEMAKVFNIKLIKRITYIYLPYVLGYLKTGCSVSLGLCWKAGIAAELIGIPDGTIGEQLYFSKIYFEMSDLFAWTVAIIFISLVFEKIFMFLLNKAIKLYERK